MNTPAAILRNIVSMLAVRVLTPLSALVLFIYASRKFSVEEVGKYSLLLAFYQMLQYVALLGLTPYITKEVSKEKNLAGKYIVNMCCIALPAAVLLGLGLYGTGSFFLKYPADVLEGLIWLGLLVMVSTVATIYETIFVAYEKIHLIASVVVVETILRLVASVWLIKSGFGFGSLIAAMAVSRFLAIGVYVLIAGRLEEGRVREARPDFTFIKELLGVCRIFLAISICSTLINRADFIFLSKMRSFEDVGFYTAGYRLLDICVLLGSTLIFVIFPFLSRLYHQSQADALDITKKYFKYLCVGMIFMVLFVFTFADPLIRLFYSDSYAVSAIILRILIFTAFFMGLDQAMAGLFIISGNQQLDLKVLIIGIFIYLLLLWALIPPFGFYGAAVATVSAMICQVSVRYVYFKKYVFDIRLESIAWRPILAGLVAVLAVTALEQLWHWLWLAPLFTFLYIALLFVLKVFGKQELDFLAALKPGAAPR